VPLFSATDQSGPTPILQVRRRCGWPATIRSAPTNCSLPGSIRWSAPEGNRLSDGRSERESPLGPSVAVHHFVRPNHAVGERDGFLWTEKVASFAEVGAEKLEIPDPAVNQNPRVCNSVVWLATRPSLHNSTGSLGIADRRALLGAHAPCGELSGEHRLLPRAFQDSPRSAITLHRNANACLAISTAASNASARRHAVPTPNVRCLPTGLNEQCDHQFRCAPSSLPFSLLTMSRSRYSRIPAAIACTICT
jgi:hypothetical protein